MAAPDSAANRSRIPEIPGRESCLDARFHLATAPFYGSLIT